MRRAWMASAMPIAYIGGERIPAMFVVRESWQGRSARGGDAFHAAHVRAEDVRDDDGAVCLLVVLHHSDHRAWQGEAAAVQRVRVFQLATLLGAVADVGAAGL